jgi:hypothetical protein
VEISFTKLVLWACSISVSFPFIVMKLLPGKIPPPFYWLSVSVIVTLILEIVSKILWTLSLNNMPLFHIHTLVDFILITLFFRSITTFLSKKTALLLSFIFTIIWLTPFIFNKHEIYRYNTISRSVASSAFILYALRYLLGSLKGDTYAGSRSIRLIIYAILIYSATCLLIFSFGQYIQGLSKDLNRAIWSIHGFIIILYNILLSIALWELQRKKLSSI